jgi:hypothetical protein
LCVQRGQVGHFAIGSFIGLGIQQGAAFVGLELGLILKTSDMTLRDSLGKPALADLVGQFTGRPDDSGGSQAKAMLWHHCSAPKVAGATRARGVL